MFNVIIKRKFFCLDADIIMTITDAMIQQSIIKSAIGSVIAFHSVTAVLLLTGLFFVGWLGGRWLLNSTSYVVYETTVADKNEYRIKKGNSHKHHISYDIRFEGTSTRQSLNSAQKDKYDSINIGDRVLIVDGVNNSYLKV